MANSQVVNVDVRQETGRNKVRKLRASGKTPAIIYGHGGESVSLSVPSDAIEKIIHQGERIVTLDGGHTGDAFIRDVQWDLYGNHVMHIDFTRVEAGEMIETTVSLELRGEAPGTKVGGIVEQPLKEMQLECPPRSMTDKIEVRLHDLQLNQKITVGDLNLPEGSKAVLDASTVVVQCVEESAETGDEDEGLSVTGPAEPEVIGEKKDDEG